MKKIYTFLLFLLFHSYFCLAQPPDGNDVNRVEAVKMAYMTQELDLTPQEAQNFWPVYNNYTNEIKQARNQYGGDVVAYEKKVVEIRERYQGNFKKVLGTNAQRVNKVYTSERQFNDLLKTEQKNRQQNNQQKNNQQKNNPQKDDQQKDNSQQKAHNQQKQFQQPQQQRNAGGNKNNNNGNKNNNKQGGSKKHPPR